MEPELVNLQRRVAELEKALIQVSAHRGRPARWAATAGAVAGALVMAAASARVFAQPGLPPPSKVTAPFEVVDGRGRTLFKVQMSASGAGLALFYDDTGEETAIIGRATGSDKPDFQVVRKGVLVAGLGAWENGGGVLALYDKTGVLSASIGTAASSGAGVMRVFNKGTPRIELGVAKGSESGSMSLFSKSKAETILVGDAGIRQTNAQGNPAAQFGVDDNSNGYVMAANPGGLFLSKLGVASNGSSGRVEVSGGGEIKVLMGVLDNGKGDLCATGSPGKQACISGLAVKTLTPY
jgi:hypothetical protein